LTIKLNWDWVIVTVKTENKKNQMMTNRNI
jgi:hypothetical protein